ncbi:MAG: nucleotidyltransferase domain-containing protein [Acidipropionibacterium sp.]|jgi:predicted nucleotidyltransferase|nr:nucleotidyltransferase domain-containing protein [Acidipropionibacterium sp.]
MPRSLTEVARRTDKAVADARSELERAVRRASRDGMSQSQIAREIGRSQPEVSRLLHFHGTSPLARRLRRHAREIRDAVAEAGGRDVRVFGSLVTGRETSDSDVDLLFTMGSALSLMQLSVLENRVAEILGSEVDLVPDSALRPDLRERILAEAVLL